MKIPIKCIILLKLKTASVKKLITKIQEKSKKLKNHKNLPKTNYKQLHKNYPKSSQIAIDSSTSNFNFYRMPNDLTSINVHFHKSTHMFLHTRYRERARLNAKEKRKTYRRPLTQIF